MLRLLLRFVVFVVAVFVLLPFSLMISVLFLGLVVPGQNVYNARSIAIRFRKLLQLATKQNIRGGLVRVDQRYGHRLRVRRGCRVQQRIEQLPKRRDARAAADQIDAANANGGAVDVEVAGAKVQNLT